MTCARSDERVAPHPQCQDARPAPLEEARSAGFDRSRVCFTLGLAAVVALVVSGCGASRRSSRSAGLMVPAETAAAQSAASSGGASDGAATNTQVNEYSYRLAPGDLLDIKFPYHPEENERVPVRPDGKIGLQVAGDITAGGLTPKQLEEEIIEKASATLRDPVVSVVVVQLAEHKVYVGGDVAKPGFVMFRDGLTPLQAVFERGGFLDTAKLSEVLLITRTGDQVQTQKLDLKAVVEGKQVEQMAMAPDDIIFVPRTFIGKVDVVVDQWIRGLLPTVPRTGLDLTPFVF